MSQRLNQRVTKFTWYNHHEDGEYLLVVCLRGDVAEADTGHAGHGVVERCYVARRFGGTPLK